MTVDLRIGRLVSVGSEPRGKRYCRCAVRYVADALPTFGTGRGGVVVAVVALSPESLQSFVHMISVQRHQLSISDTERNSQLAPSEMPGSVGLDQVHRLNRELIGKHLAELDGGLTAIGLLAHWCGKNFQRLDGRSAADIRAAQNAESPSRNPLLGHDRRFTAVDPISVVDMTAILNINASDVSVHAIPLTDELTFEQQWEMIKQERDINAPRIEAAAMYWEKAHGWLSSTSLWLQDKDGVIAAAIQGAASEALGELTSKWARVVQPLATAIAGNSAVLKAQAERIHKAYIEMAGIKRDYFDFPTDEASRLLSEEADLVEVLMRLLPPGEELMNIVDRWASRAVAVRNALMVTATVKAWRVMEPLNESLAGAARRIYLSLDDPPAWWWKQAPQADPGTDLDRLGGA